MSHASLISGNRIGRGGCAIGLCLAVNNRLQKLYLHGCRIGNDGLTNLLSTDDCMIHNSLTDLDLDLNLIHGADGGRKLTLLLQRFPALKVQLVLNNNPLLGSHGAHALVPGLAAASQMEQLELYGCGLGNEGVMNLVPDGQVNRSLTMLDLRDNNIEEGFMGGESVVALAARCTNLDSLDVDANILSPDQQHRLGLLLYRKRLCTEASALAGGSTFSVLFQAVEEAHSHEHGLGAIFVILQNDGDDHFCTANNRAIE